MEEDQDEVSLEELSERSSLPVRAIRSYIEQGLLRGPSSKGRYARYGDYHLRRLLAIRALRDQGHSLAEIRRELLSMSDEAIDRTAAMASATASGPAQAGSALDYLRSLSGQPTERPQPEGEFDALPAMRGPARMSASVASTPPLTKTPETSNPFERLLVALQQSLAMRRVDRQAHSEAWFRIEITPDLELHVRGALSPEARVTLERLSDYLREVALGGPGPTTSP